MDYTMPQMDGPTAVREIRKLGFRGRIVGLTGQMQSTEVKFFLQSGVDEVLSKPLDMPRLKAICDEILLGSPPLPSFIEKRGS